MMKASEVIAKLTRIVSEHGDLDVFASGEMGWDEIDQVEVELVDSLDVPWNAGDEYRNDGPRNPCKEHLPIGSKFIGIV